MTSLNPFSWDTKSFVDFLERKQYMRGSMIERMFERRGEWSNQFGRHPHMGFWSYFEEQYSAPGWGFVPFLFLGLLGMYVAIRKRWELGLPFFTLFILCSVGLILYMNFADGTMYDARIQDAHMEVRNRDYFFTPAFVFFGVAMGMGVAALVMHLLLAVKQDAGKKAIVFGSAVLLALPLVALTRHYYANDRSDNILPYVMAKNVVDTCEEDAILFTFGDNETYPMWCLQEAYDYRKDVRMINLSLLQSDWYVWQVKNRMNVPLSLTDEQILWYPVERSDGLEMSQPRERFHDRPRGVMTLLTPYRHGDQIVRVSHMVVDDIVIENKWRNPIYFSNLPYAESPLGLRDRCVATGLLYKLEREPTYDRVNPQASLELFENHYIFDGLGNSDIYRDNGTTRDFLLTLGPSVLRTYESLMRAADTANAIGLLEKMTREFAEYWQPYLILSDMAMESGDTVRALEILENYRDLISGYHRQSEGNRYYLADLGMVTYEIGKRISDTEKMEQGIDMMWQAFDANRNDMLNFRKLAAVLIETQRYSDLRRAGLDASRYGRNMGDRFLQTAISGGSGGANPFGGGNTSGTGSAEGSSPGGDGQ
jgi:hypothetical protein